MGLRRACLIGGLSVCADPSNKPGVEPTEGPAPLGIIGRHNQGLLQLNKLLAQLSNSTPRGLREESLTSTGALMNGRSMHKCVTFPPEKNLEIQCNFFFIYIYGKLRFKFVFLLYSSWNHWIYQGIIPYMSVYNFYIVGVSDVWIISCMTQCVNVWKRNAKNLYVK